MSDEPRSFSEPLPTGLLLRVELTPRGAANPLVREEAEVRDVFDAIHELERVTGPRFRRRIHEAAAASLLRLRPPGTEG